MVPRDAVARVSARPSRPATLARVQSMISGFAALGGAVTAAVGAGVARGDATGVPGGVAANDGEALELDGVSELVGAPTKAAGMDAWSVQAAMTDVATATTRSRLQRMVIHVVPRCLIWRGDVREPLVLRCRA